jgi:hypothetical protein
LKQVDYADMWNRQSPTTKAVLLVIVGLAIEYVVFFLMNDKDPRVPIVLVIFALGPLSLTEGLMRLAVPYHHLFEKDNFVDAGRPPSVGSAMALAIGIRIIGLLLGIAQVTVMLLYPQLILNHSI